MKGNVKTRTFEPRALTAIALAVSATALAIAALVLTIALPAYAASIFASGSGTQADPYTIQTADQLEAFRDSVNSGTSYEGEYISLTADIALPASNWTPIGQGTRQSSGYTTDSTPFKGTFNGNGHTISNLTITSTSGGDYAIGLFGVLDGATVENMTIDANVNVPTSELAGIAAGLMVNDATVSNIQTKGSISALCGTGGVVGRMTISGTIAECTNDATVATTGGSGNTGGIVGAAYYTDTGQVMTIANCTNNASVTGKNAVGGIVGLSAAYVTHCTNNGTVTGSDYGVGGIIGNQSNYGTIAANTNTADITNTSTSAYGTGGIVGWVRYNGAPPSYNVSAPIAIDGNSNSATVKGGNDVGGIVGVLYNAGSVLQNTNTAPSLTSSNFVGGIVGNMQNLTPDALPSGVTPGATVENNVSTTPLSDMTGTLKDLYAYNNDPTVFTVKDNSATLPDNPADPDNPDPGDKDDPSSSDPDNPDSAGDGSDDNDEGVGGAANGTGDDGAEGTSPAPTNAATPNTHNIGSALQQTGDRTLEETIPVILAVMAAASAIAALAVYRLRKVVR